MQRPIRPPTNRDQIAAAVEAVWRSSWPYVAASIIAVIMLFPGLAVAGLEAANLEVGNGVDVNVQTAGSTVDVNIQRGKGLRIGVGLWSGAIIAVAAIVILVISKSISRLKVVESSRSFRLHVECEILDTHLSSTRHRFHDFRRNQHRDQCPNPCHRCGDECFQLRRFDPLQISSRTSCCSFAGISHLSGFPDDVFGRLFGSSTAARHTH